MAAQKQLQPEALNELFRSWKIDVISSGDDDKDGSSIEKTNTDLHHEAMACFQSTVLNHEQAVALLIKDLGPAFTAKSLPVRLRGLYVLLGAIEGSFDKNMSNSSLVLLGNFLSLQCGPIVDDEYEEDYDSMIRDISIKCLSGLVETSTPQINSAALITQEYAEAFEIRMNFAKKGVEGRCTTPDDDEMSAENDIRGGLSTMPRSKRSLCFSLLRCAVMGASKVTKFLQPCLKKPMNKQQSTIFSSIQSQCVQFAEFIARCMHGESDPRCLLQLLELLHFTQVNFQDWFSGENTRSPNNVFPNEDFFDAVAPYYPIQFTPPPNNIHGITREGLHTALTSVLTFTAMDEGARRYRKPTMMSCSFNLFLEQLLPGQPEEDSTSTLEKLEGLECISNLFFPTSKKEIKRLGEFSMESECTNLTFEEVRNLSTALITTHHEASVGTTNESGDLRDQNKTLAENCRSLASIIAMELEKHSKNGTQRLWDRFVSEPLEKEMKKLELTPAYAKTSIAYGASLAASGGPRTLRVCLAKGLGPLLKYLRGHINDAGDNTLATIHGIAAFVSSSQVTLSKSRMELGVELTPHPLEAYAKDTCMLLLEIVECEDTSCSFLLKTAACSCLGCLFFSSIDKDLEFEQHVERIFNFLRGLIENVMVPAQDELDSDQDELARYRIVSSSVLGRIIGTSLTESDDDENPKNPISRSILLSLAVQDFIRTEIFSNLMAASLGSAGDYNGDRYDRMTLSTACSSSPSLASTVVRAHLEALLNAVKDNTTSFASQSCIDALACILRSCVGDNAIRAFHENDMVDDIIDVLCENLITGVSSEENDMVSQIALEASTSSGNEESMESKVRPSGYERCFIVSCFSSLSQYLLFLRLTL